MEWCHNALPFLRNWIMNMSVVCCRSQCYWFSNKHSLFLQFNGAISSCFSWSVFPLLVLIQKFKTLIEYFSEHQRIILTCLWQSFFWNVWVLFFGNILCCCRDSSFELFCLNINFSYFNALLVNLLPSFWGFHKDNEHHIYGAVAFTCVIVQQHLSTRLEFKMMCILLSFLTYWKTCWN